MSISKEVPEFAGNQGLALMQARWRNCSRWAGRTLKLPVPQFPCLKTGITGPTSPSYSKAHMCESTVKLQPATVGSEIYVHGKHSVTEMAITGIRDASNEVNRKAVQSTLSLF